MYHVEDPGMGKVVSISFWESLAHLAELKDRTPPDGPMGLKPDKVEVFSEVVQT